MYSIITAKEYAKKIGYSPSSITKRLRSQNEPYALPGADAVEKIGNTWMIRIPKNFNAQKAKKSFRNNLLVNSNLLPL